MQDYFLPFIQTTTYIHFLPFLICFHSTCVTIIFFPLLSVSFCFASHSFSQSHTYIHTHSLSLSVTHSLTLYFFLVSRLLDDTGRERLSILMMSPKQTPLFPLCIRCLDFFFSLRSPSLSFSLFFFLYRDVLTLVSALCPSF